MKMPGTVFQMPADKEEKLRRVRRLEWISLAFMSTIVIVIGLAMGSSEAMKAAWMEDMLSLIPPAAVLVAIRYMGRDPNPSFPYGYRRAALLAFLFAAFALLSLGLYMLLDAAMTLLLREHPTIGTLTIAGRPVWQGWVMIAALVYSVIPPIILGRKKLPLATELHLKALHADAEMNKGDWLTGIAGVLGIVGIALGFWWADAVAAAVISIEILKDGTSNLRNSLAQVMNKRPTAVETKEPDSTPDDVQRELERLDWVACARVRLREDGDVLTGEAFVVPRDEERLLARLEEARDVVNEAHWRTHDVSVVPVRSLETE
jgi:cation diffusion facilitator family transporter